MGCSEPVLEEEGGMGDKRGDAYDRLPAGSGRLQTVSG